MKDEFELDGGESTEAGSSSASMEFRSTQFTIREVNWAHVRRRCRSRTFLWRSEKERFHQRCHRMRRLGPSSRSSCDA